MRYKYTIWNWIKVQIHCLFHFHQTMIYETYDEGKLTTKEIGCWTCEKKKYGIDTALEIIRKDNPPPDKSYIDLGENSTCLNCHSRYCICKERQDGTIENNLPIIKEK